MHNVPDDNLIRSKHVLEETTLPVYEGDKKVHLHNCPCELNEELAMV
jgi:hypothetical protein